MVQKFPEVLCRLGFVLEKRFVVECILYLSLVFLLKYRCKNRAELWQKETAFSLVGGFCRGLDAMTFVHKGGNGAVDGGILQGEVVVVLVIREKIFELAGKETDTEV